MRATDDSVSRPDVLQPGARVVVRYRIDDDAHAVTDAIGTVVRRDGAAVEVETRTRGVVRISLADVTHAKAVPPAPVRRGGRDAGQGDAAT